jgi:hypothetical protein
MHTRLNLADACFSADWNGCKVHSDILRSNSFTILYMAGDITVDADKFDAVLRRMLTMKPMTAKELSTKLKAEKAAKIVQKMDKPR